VGWEAQCRSDSDGNTGVRPQPKGGAMTTKWSPEGRVYLSPSRHKMS